MVIINIAKLSINSKQQPLECKTGKSLKLLLEKKKMKHCYLKIKH